MTMQKCLKLPKFCLTSQGLGLAWLIAFLLPMCALDSSGTKG